MKDVCIKVLIFFLCNAVGLILAPTLYGAALYGIILNVFDPESLSFVNTSTEDDMMITIFTWATCLLFSFASFFFIGRWRKFFLLAPIVFPILCAFGLLISHL